VPPAALFGGAELAQLRVQLLIGQGFLGMCCQPPLELFLGGWLAWFGRTHGAQVKRPWLPRRLGAQNGVSRFAFPAIVAQHGDQSTRAGNRCLAPRQPSGEHRGRECAGSAARGVRLVGVLAEREEVGVGVQVVAGPIGTDHPGAFAQTGTSRGEPARPIVPDDVPDDVLETIADAVGDYILEGLL